MGKSFLSKKPVGRYQRGAVVPEYIVVLAILFPIFVIIGIVLQRQAITSAASSARAVSDVVPCGIKSDIGLPNVDGTPTVPDECK